MKKSAINLLLVEDKQADARLIQEFLKDSEFLTVRVTHVRRLETALQKMEESEFEAILLDLKLPDADGLEGLKQIRKVNRGVPVIVLTVREEEPIAMEALKLGAGDYLGKSQLNSAMLTRVLRYTIERQRSHENQRETEEHYKLLVEGATGMAIIMLDLNGLVIEWNKGAERLFHYQEPEVLHKHFSMFFTEEDLAQGRPERELLRARKNEKGDDDNWLVRKDGTWFWASGAVSAVRDEAEHLKAYAKIIRDMSEKKRIEDQLREANSSLENRVEERTKELVSYQRQLRNLANELTLAGERERHQLGTDLHDFLAQLLVASRLKLAQAKRWDFQGEVASLLDEVDKMLDQSLTYTRTLVADLSPPILFEMGISAALSWLGSQMGKHGLHVTVEGAEVKRDFPKEKAILIYRCVRELLFNVLKHSGVKEAVVSVELKESNHLQVTVMDEGKGIEYYSKGAKSVQAEGKFGLFSIQERLTALGGTFLVETGSSKGTRVTLTIPSVGGSREIAPTTSKFSNKKTKDKAGPVTLLEKSADRIRILIADDHQMVREGFCSLLEGQKNFEVIGQAEDGEEAVRLAHDLQPDIVIMDVHMKKLDGIEATRRITKELPSIPIIGLSVHAEKEVANAMLQAGAAEFLNKGGEADLLCQAIRTLHRNRDQPSSPKQTS